MVEIRRQLLPGDLGDLIAMHGSVYAREHGVDSTFEAYVAAGVARAALRGWPDEREGVWIVERDSAMKGSIAFTDEGGDTATLRWFVLEPALRGQGLGRRLVGEVIDEVSAHGFSLLRLETFSELRTAAHLYRAHGFELVHAETGPRWGRDEITYQHYELKLPRPRERFASNAVAGAA
jgi:GNAT superfamily N-acetyltransferase